MYATYLEGSNITGAQSATGQTLGVGTEADIEVKKILLGLPVTSGNLWFFSNQNPGVNTATTGLVAKLTLGSSVATSQLPAILDLTDSN